MIFNWDEFTEIDFVDYCSKIENEMLYADDYVGAIRIGEICCDFVLRELETGILTLTYDVYVGGVDTGYGYSARDALKTGKYTNKNDVPADELYPYNYADGGSFADSCISMTYDNFKRMAEDKISAYLIENNLLEKANMELHKW